MRFNVFGFYLLFLLALAACTNSQKEAVKTDPESSLPGQLSKKDSIEVGEDKKEFSALVKNIYKTDDGIFIVLDFVEVVDHNTGEREVRNANPKLRKYMAVDSTLIYLKNCKEVKASDLLLFHTEILKDSIQIAVGSAKNGKLESINFGCYD